MERVAADVESLDFGVGDLDALLIGPLNERTSDARPFTLNTIQLFLRLALARVGRVGTKDTDACLTVVANLASALEIPAKRSEVDQVCCCADAMRRTKGRRNVPSLSFVQTYRRRLSNEPDIVRCDFYARSSLRVGIEQEELAVGDPVSGSGAAERLFKAGTPKS
jgi:hypothetical protein